MCTNNPYIDSCYICGDGKSIWLRTCGSQECKRKDKEFLDKSNKNEDELGTEGALLMSTVEKTTEEQGDFTKQLRELVMRHFPSLSEEDCKTMSIKTYNLYAHSEVIRKSKQANKVENENT